MFNPQAVLMYSSPKYHLVLSTRPGYDAEFTATLQSNGNYAVRVKSRVDADDLHNAILTCTGINAGFYYQTDQADMLKIAAAIGARVNPAWEHAHQAEAAFHTQQIKSHLSATAPLEFVQEKAAFIQRATALLEEFKKQVVPSYPIRELTNPMHSLTLAKRREGIFIWPDWEDSRYVNIIMNLPEADRRKMRNVLHDWTESENLRINIGVNF